MSNEYPQHLDIKHKCMFSAQNGNLDALKKARQEGCPWDWSTCAYAAAKGHIHILEWAHQNGAPMDEHVCNNAAANGHLHILKWARQHGAPWNSGTCETYSSAETVSIYWKDSTIFDWVRSNGCPMPNSSRNISNHNKSV